MFHSFIISHIYKESADLAVDYSPIEVLALPLKSNKTTGNLRRYDKPLARIQQDGYYSHTHRHLLLTLILTFNSESCEVPCVKHKASINAIQYVQTYPKRRETYPSSVDFRVQR